MLDLTLRICGAAMIPGAAMTGSLAALDLGRLGALSGPLATSMSTLATSDATCAALLLALAALCWIAAAALSRHRRTATTAV